MKHTLTEIEIPVYPADREFFSSFYVPKEERAETFYYNDFTIADIFGNEAIEDTFKHALKDADADSKNLVELAFVLNHKCAQHYQKWEETQDGEEENIAKLYSTLYYLALDFADTLPKEEQIFFYRAID